MHFQWYPGHMTKAKRMMQENIKLIDLVIELVDARLPVSSRNPDIDELGKNKARLILLNKADLAEEKWNDAWAEYFKKKGYSVVKVNSKKGGGIKSIQGVIQEACREDRKRQKARDLKPPGACNGRWDSECRKINVYQCTGRKSLCQDRE